MWDMQFTLPGCIWHSVQPPVCMCVGVCVCVYVHVCVGVHVCVCVCVYVCPCTYTMYINKLLLAFISSTLQQSGGVIKDLV